MAKRLSWHPWPRNPALLALHAPVFAGVLRLLPTFLPLPAPGEQAATGSLCGGNAEAVAAGSKRCRLPRAYLVPFTLLLCVTTELLRCQQLASTPEHLPLKTSKSSRRLGFLQ